MEAYISNGGLPPNYECHEKVNWTFDRWLEEGEPHVLIGVSNIIFGIICILLYIPCCIVLLQPELRALTAYKFLFLLAVFQIAGLIQNSIFSGFFFIQGAVYCNYPNINYFVGISVMQCWTGVCSTSFLLGVSRLADLWNPAWHDALFGGKRVLFSFFLIFSYSTAFLLFAKPTVFNSKQMTWHFDPFVYPDGSNVMAYLCYITVLNNEGAVSLNLILTVLFIAAFAYKSARYRFKMSRTQKQIFLQSFVCNMNNLVGASIFCSYLFINGGPLYNYLGLLIWQFSASSDLAMFLLINRTVRNHVLALVGLKKYAANSVHSTTNGRRSQNYSNTQDTQQSQQ